MRRKFFLISIFGAALVGLNTLARFQNKVPDTLLTHPSSKLPRKSRAHNKASGVMLQSPKTSSEASKDLPSSHVAAPSPSSSEVSAEGYGACPDGAFSGGIAPYGKYFDDAKTRFIEHQNYYSDPQREGVYQRISGITRSPGEYDFTWEEVADKDVASSGAVIQRWSISYEGADESSAPYSPMDQSPEEMQELYRRAIHQFSNSIMEKISTKTSPSVIRIYQCNEGTYTDELFDYDFGSKLGTYSVDCRTVNKCLCKKL